MSKQVTEVVKEAKNAVLSKLCDQIDNVITGNSKRIPYGFVAKQVQAVNDVCPWITRHSIMNYYRRRCKQTKLISPAQEDDGNEICTPSPEVLELAIVPFIQTERK